MGRVLWNAFCTWFLVAAMGSKELRAPGWGSSLSDRHSSASGGVCVRHCSTLFMKQVLPRLTRPHPCDAGCGGGGGGGGGGVGGGLRDRAHSWRLLLAGNHR
jgi:hypothetical protein